MEMQDNKIYSIGGLQFELATNQSLRIRSKVDSYVNKIPGLNNKTAKGLTYKETLDFYLLILKRTKKTFIENLIPKGLLNCFYKNRFNKMSEKLQLEITADFFLKRISLRISGIGQGTN